MPILLAYFVNTLVNVAVGLLVARFLGPAEFGRFAVALAGANALQLLVFDWLRYAAARFHGVGEGEAGEAPAPAASLDAAFMAIAVALALACGLVLAAGFRLGLSGGLVALAATAAIVNGFYDYRAAQVRARFEDGLYARLVLTKNGLALLGTAGGAFVFGTAGAALAGVAFSMAGSLALSWGALRRTAGARPSPGRSQIFESLHYALPIVTAGALYALIPLANRAVAAHLFGFAEAGQFSLAFDIGTRLVAAVGTALDVVLFQLAVRAAGTSGIEQGQKQVARNFEVFLAVLAPACLGALFVLPSLQKIAVPPEFRGPFAAYFSLLLPGLFLWGLASFGLNPVFQIARRTRPLVLAASVAALGDALLLAILPVRIGPHGLALAQTGAMILGALALAVLARRSGAHRPRTGQVAAILLATIAMGLALWPMRGWPPGAGAAAVEIATGVFVYGLTALVLDIGSLRQLTFAQRRRGKNPS